MIIGILIIIAFIVLYIMSSAVETDGFKVKSSVLIPFTKIAVFLINIIYSETKIQKKLIKKEVVEELKTINPAMKEEKIVKSYYVEKISLVLGISLLGAVISVLTGLPENLRSTDIDTGYMIRNEVNDGEVQKKLTVSVDNIINNEEITVNIAPKKLTESETFSMFETAYDQLKDIIPGNNTSLMEVREELNLVTTISNLPLNIEWKTDNYELVQPNGSVANNEVSENGSDAELTAYFTYEEYEAEFKFNIKVLPPNLSEPQKIKNKLLKLLERANEETRLDDKIELPKSIDGNSIVWSSKSEKTDLFIIALFIGTGILIYFGKDSDLKEEVIKRDRQLVRDYPDIISKLTLLLGAGMTIKGAWKKVALDYRDRKEKEAYFSFAYEEMLVTYYQITGGVSELKAYEAFGRRCKNQRYMKLSALITQNIRKGSTGLSKILEGGSLDAFEDRKAYARTLGEEAGTKLMIPMFISLIIVLVIIMIPALMSFQL